MTTAVSGHDHDHGGVQLPHATLQDYLSDYRLTLLMKCEGLDAEQLARRSVPPSTMSLLGLLRHLGYLVEEGATDKMFTNPSDSRTEGYITGRFG